MEVAEDFQVVEYRALIARAIHQAAHLVLAAVLSVEVEVLREVGSSVRKLGALGDLLPRAPFHFHFN